MTHVYPRGRRAALRSMCAAALFLGLHTAASAQADLIVGLGAYGR
ncbi:hypothetical protein [Solirubrum puertoriconensis]|nr:hypothetical protein [Solirubrum puertoriconensis]